VIVEHVFQAGAGQITAWQAAVKGGIPMTVPALTVNKVCLSGLNAIAMADQLIGYGEFDVDATAHDALRSARTTRGPACTRATSANSRTASG
jgi:acetyl-CoA acetyltransferase